MRSKLIWCGERGMCVFFLGVVVCRHDVVVGVVALSELVLWYEL